MNPTTRNTMSSSRTKTALVTGASSGIGYATAIELAKRGYIVYAGARRLEPMAPLKEKGIRTIQLDVTSTESVQQAKELIEKETNGYLDLLYNNAGQSCTFPATDVTDEAAKQCFEVNVLAPVRLVREFIPLLINAKGVIGFTGSVAGKTPFPFSSIYGATKAAIHQYAAVLRLELKPFGVKVINVVTGGVKTNIADNRPIPLNSLYRVDESFEEAIFERQNMAARNNPISAEEYAKQVVDDFEGATTSGYLNVYRGHMAYLLAFVTFFVPRRLLEIVFIRKFKLVTVFEKIQAKYAKAKAD